MINEVQQIFSFSLDACIKTNYGLRHTEKSEDVGENKKSIIINEEYCVILNDQELEIKNIESSIILIAK